MDISPNYFFPFFPTHEIDFKNVVWDEIKKAQDQKRTKDILYLLLNYINSESRFDRNLLEKKQLQLLQGARPLDFVWTDSELSIQSKVISLHKPVELPILRKLGEFSFFDLKLTRLKIKESTVQLEFRDSWETMDPYKLFDALDEICSFGDYLENYLNKKFKVPLVYGNARESYSEKKLKSAYDFFTQRTKEFSDIIKDCDQKRYRDLAIEYFWNYLLQIEYTLVPRGFLSLDIKSAIADLSGSQSFDIVFSKAQVNLSKFQNYNYDEFKTSFYMNKSFMPSRRMAYLNKAKSHFEDYLVVAAQYKNKQDHAMNTLYLTTAIYTFRNRFFSEPQVEEYLDRLLFSASSKKFKAAADILNSGIEKLVFSPDTIQSQSYSLGWNIKRGMAWIQQKSSN